MSVLPMESNYIEKVVLYTHDFSYTLTGLDAVQWARDIESFRNKDRLDSVVFYRWKYHSIFKFKDFFHKYQCRWFKYKKVEMNNDHLFEI